MWSLRKNNGDGTTTNLEPLKFSNGKTQEDIVRETVEAVKEGHKIILINGMCGTGKCLAGDALVFCKPLKTDYFSYRKISELSSSEGLTLALNSEGNIIETPYCNVRKTGVKKLYKLKTRTGREIRVSDNHPFLTITNKGAEWKPLKELNHESYICLPNKILTKEVAELEDDKIRILAHLIAEGKLGDKAGSPVYTQNKIINPETRKDYEKALKRVFPEGEVKSYNDKDVVITFGNMDTTSGTTNKLKLLIREFGLEGKKSREKFVPQIIFNLSKEKIGLFLKTIYSGDGCIYKRRGKNNKEGQVVIEYSSISGELIKGISILLNMFGVQHTIRTKGFREEKDYVKSISISNHHSLKLFIENIGFIGRKQRDALKFYESLKDHKYNNIDKVPRIIRDYLKNEGHSWGELDRYLNYEAIKKRRNLMCYKMVMKDRTTQTPTVFKQGKIDFLRIHLRKINEYIKDDNIEFICNESIVWDKIRSIDPLEEETVYDLEVPEHHNFIADGIIVHNSAIALNIAKELGRASIVVPVKGLQKQYEDDYTKKMCVIKENGELLKISSIKGRRNFKCLYHEENPEEFRRKEEVVQKNKEKNTTLNIFGNTIDNSYDRMMTEEKGRITNMRREIDKTADNDYLPCKIEIKENNKWVIKEYLKKNPKIDVRNFHNLKNVRRMSIAPVCPYWSPIIPTEKEVNIKAVEKKYLAVGGIPHTLYLRKEGCEYYEQYKAYADADVIIFNSQKYKIENILNRKPATDVEIIDECDEFLDSYSNYMKINLDRLAMALGRLYTDDDKTIMNIRKVISIITEIKNDPTINNSRNEEIKLLKETRVEEILRQFTENHLLDAVEYEEESYAYHAEEVARTFEKFTDETYVSYEKESNETITAKLITTNLEKRFKSELLDKNRIVIMMSGTPHSEAVLRDIYGLQGIKIIEAETLMPGSITKKRTGMEFNCRYDNFKKGNVTREHYLQVLKKCVEEAKKPLLVHVNSFKDLPTENEAERFKLTEIMTQEKLHRVQESDNEGRMIREFKKGMFPVLYSTKCNRGVDFPGETCNSILITKYPYPDVNGLFWKVLKQTKPQHYNSFYTDKSKREYLQRIYRGLRSKGDHIELLSPDIRIHYGV